MMKHQCTSKSLLAGAFLIISLFSLMVSACTSTAETLPPPPEGEVTEKPGLFHEEIQAFRETEVHRHPPENSIVFTGSSSFRLWEGLEDEYAEYGVINRGFGGSRMSDVLENYDELILHYSPRAVFVYEGDNDIYDGRTVNEVADDFARFLARTRRELGDIPVIFILPKPSGSRWEYRDKYRAHARAVISLTESDPNARVIDSWDLFLDESGMVSDAYFQEDRLHMNEAGYDIWRELITPVLEEITSQF